MEGAEGRRPERLSRRGFIKAGAGAVGAAAALAPCVVLAQQAASPTPPSVVTSPPRQWGRHSPPEIYPDPDILIIDPSFNDLLLGITAIHRVWTGSLWAEGPAWSSQGQYLVFSDVQANVQYRYLWDLRDAVPFRRPSYNSNGNSFDFQGRQLSTEDFFRRVIRWEHDGTMTVIAESFEGKPLNSPNDLVPHPDGSIWFTDPAYGDTLSEGHPDTAGGLTNPKGLFNPLTGAENAGAVGGQQRQLPTNVYRWDPSGKLEVVIGGGGAAPPHRPLFFPPHQKPFAFRNRKGTGGNRPGGEGGVLPLSLPSTQRAPTPR